MATRKPAIDESSQVSNAENISYGAVIATDVSSLRYPSFYPYSLICIGLCVLMSDMARGIYFPTLWLNIYRFGGNHTNLGIAVAAFSAGRIVSTPIFGSMSEKRGYKLVLIMCNVCLMTGCIFYYFAGSVETIIAAQALMGLGAGNLGVTRSYIVECSHPSTRTVNLAYLNALQYTGFTVTPIIGAVLASIFHKSQSFERQSFLLDQFSIPSVTMFLIALFTNILILTVFQEIVRTEYSHVGSDESSNTFNAENCNESTPSIEMIESADSVDPLQYDTNVHTCAVSLQMQAAVAGCLLNLAVKGTIGAFETLGSEFVISHFGWTANQAGKTYALFGAIGVCSLLLFPLFTRCLSDIQLILGGMVVMVLGCLLISGKTTVAISQTGFLWALFLMYSLGYPVAHTALLGAYSKIVKSGPQGSLLGWFGSAGSIGRVFFPLLAGILADVFDDSAIFCVMGVVLVICIVLVVLSRSIIAQIVTA